MSQPRPLRRRPHGSCGAAVVQDPLGSARLAGLRYVSDAQPGISRAASRSGFTYRRPDGSPVRDRQTLDRIRLLGIPPAWTDVWISPDPNGHVQATGRDAKDRKQYRYHPRWRAVRDESKYHHLIAFGEALPRIRERVDRHLALPGLSRERVLASVAALLDETFIRIGNEEYVRDNESFGLTTLRNRHVTISGATLSFTFRGKSGKVHKVALKDRRLARIIQRIRDLPGYELFHYLDEHGKRHGVDSSDVNDYLKEVSGEDFTAKDFRTWAGTVAATRALERLGEPESATAAKHNVAEAIEEAASRLGNTPTICRKCYVHPDVVEAYVDGRLFREERRLTEAEVEATGLKPEEERILAVLRRLERQRSDANPEANAS